MRNTLAFILIFLSSFCYSQEFHELTDRVNIDKGYFDSGELEYYSKTIRKGIDKNNGRIYGKQIIKLKEYYKSGRKELKEKKVLPRIVEEQHLLDDRHILRQKQIKRKYKMWNKDGDKLEKGKYTHRGDKKIIKYKYQGYKKVIITFDREVGRDVIIKKKPLYK